MTDELRNKVALVTGGSSGIGRAAALAFAKAGARVVVAARDEERGEGVVREVERAARQSSSGPTWRRRRTWRPWSDVR